MSEYTRRADCQWAATTTVGLDTVKLTVKGVCQEPTPGFRLTLTRLDVPGSDPDTLLLVLTVCHSKGRRARQTADGPSRLPCALDSRCARQTADITVQTADVPSTG
jgi:hypothetical protein